MLRETWVKPIPSLSLLLVNHRWNPNKIVEAMAGAAHNPGGRKR
jgi:hypothetical protein